MQQEAEEVGMFEDMLAEWAGCCGACKIERSEEVYHEPEACPRRETDMWERMREGTEMVWEEMITKKRFANYSACFGCGLPQEICEQWEAASDDGRLFRRVRGKKCQYKGVLFRIMVAQRARGDEWWQYHIGQMMGEKIEVSDKEQMSRIYGWLGELVEWGGKAGGGMQASRLCQVVIRLDRLWIEQGGK